MNCREAYGNNLASKFSQQRHYSKISNIWQLSTKRAFKSRNRKTDSLQRENQSILRRRVRFSLPLISVKETVSITPQLRLYQMYIPSIRECFRSFVHFLSEVASSWCSYTKSLPLILVLTGLRLTGSPKEGTVSWSFFYRNIYGWLIVIIFIQSQLMVCTGV